jgi:hypothetical protein
MPDISMCKDHECPSRLKCYRYMAEPSEQWQPYAKFERRPNADRCVFFWTILNNPSVVKNAKESTDEN